MNRTEYEEITHHMHREILVDQFGGRAFSKDEVKYLTTVHKGTDEFAEVLNTLSEAGMITPDNLIMKTVEPNLTFHGQCITQKHEGRYYHTIELNSRTIATLLHELAHACCFDYGVYEDYTVLNDSTAHAEDFDAMMKALINVALAGR